MLWCGLVALRGAAAASRAKPKRNARNRASVSVYSMGCSVSTEAAATADNAPTGCSVSTEAVATVDSAAAPRIAASVAATLDPAALVQSLHGLGEEIGASLSTVKNDVSHLRMDLREDCADLNQTLRELRASLEILTHRGQQE